MPVREGGSSPCDRRCTKYVDSGVRAVGYRGVVSHVRPAAVGALSKTTGGVRNLPLAAISDLDRAAFCSVCSTLSGPVSPYVRPDIPYVCSQRPCRGLRFTSPRLGSAQLGSARLGSARCPQLISSMYIHGNKPPYLHTKTEERRVAHPREIARGSVPLPLVCRVCSTDGQTSHRTRTVRLTSPQEPPQSRLTTAHSSPPVVVVAATEYAPRHVLYSS